MSDGILSSTVHWLKRGRRDPAYHPMRHLSTWLAKRYGVNAGDEVCTYVTTNDGHRVYWHEGLLTFVRCEVVDDE